MKPPQRSHTASLQSRRSTGEGGFRLISVVHSVDLSGCPVR